METIKQNIRQYAMIIALITIMMLFQALTGGVLLRPINVQRLIMQNSYILILAIGMVLCILTGGNIDLSVGSIVALVSASSALFSVFLGLPVILSMLLSIGLGILAGMWQGYFIAYARIPSFIVTLSGMLVFRGINNLILNGETVGLPDLYIIIASGSIPDFFGNGSMHITTFMIGIVCAIVFLVLRLKQEKRKQRYAHHTSNPIMNTIVTVVLMGVIILFSFWLALAEGLPYIVILLAVLIACYSFVARKTVIGRHIYALGGNEKAAQLSGIKTNRVLFGVYANMGFLSAIAGIVFAGRLNASSPLAGQGFELDAIAACFIGGASATGGVGTVIGAIVGGLIMGILNNGMSIMGVSVFWQQIVKGLVLLAAVAFDVYSKNKSRN